jgi:hypothetical protein
MRAYRHVQSFALLAKFLRIFGTMPLHLSGQVTFLEGEKGQALAAWRQTLQNPEGQGVCTGSQGLLATQ